MIFSCWIFPGIALIGAFLFTFLLTFNSTPNSNLIQWAILALFILILIGNGIFSSILKITAEDGRECVTARSVALKTFIFCILQIMLAPLVAFSAVVGCSAITSVGSNLFP